MRRKIMNKEMQDLVAWVIKTTKSAGADNCKVNLDSNRSVEISYRDRQPENIKEASTKALNIEIFVNGRFSVQSTSDLRKGALQDFIANAVAATKLLAEDPFRTLPDPKYYQGRAELDLELVDPVYKSFTPENRHEMVKALEKACLEEGGDKVISVTAQEQDGCQESLQMTSNGFAGYMEGTYYSTYAEMTAKGEGDRRPNGYSYAVAVSRKDLPDSKAVGVRAAQRTLAMVGAKKIKTETLPIIIENQNVSRILGGFIGAMLGRSIQQKRSFLADKKGLQIASKHLTLIDDPLIKSGLGSRLFDSDGFSAQKRTIIEAGILKEFFIDWYYSRKLGWEPTSGSPANLVIPPGQRPITAIMKDLGRGILITGFIGGNSNPTTGDTSMGISGQLFENGEPVQAVDEMNIADNHLKFWNKLIGVANDPFMSSAYRFPSLVFENVVVSGL
jgi:PmbA protein